MSKLVKNKGEAPIKRTETKSKPLTEDMAREHVAACRKLAVAHTRSVFDVYHRLLFDALGAESTRIKNKESSSEWLDVQNLVKQKKGEIKRIFCDCVSNGFIHLIDSVAKNDNDKKKQEQSSALKKNAIAEDVIISAVVRHIEDKVSDSLWVSTHRLSVLCGGRQIYDDKNPMSPVQLCLALLRSIDHLNFNFNVKKVIFSAFAKPLVSLTTKTLNSTNAYLKEQGVLPNIQYQSCDSSSLDDGASAPIPNTPNLNIPNSSLPKPSTSSSKEDVEINSTADEGGVNLIIEPGLIEKIREIQKSIRKTTSTLESTNDKQIPSEELIQILNVLHEQAPNLKQAVKEGESLAVSKKDVPSQVLIEQLKKDERIKQSDMEVVDLVGMLFEFMLNDDSLPPSLKALLSYLHTPFLKIAFTDKQFFECVEHPARLLLDTLTEAGSQWIDAQGHDEFDMYERIKDVVTKIQNAKSNETKLVTELLLGFRGELKLLKRKQNMIGKKAKEKALGEGRLLDAKETVAREISERIRDKDLPSCVLVFLSQAWSDYLSFTLLRSSQNSETWKKGLELIDELVWSAEPKFSIEEQSQLKECYPQIIKRIKDGLIRIGFTSLKANDLTASISAFIDLSVNKTLPVPVVVNVKTGRKAIEKNKATEENKPIEQDEDTYDPSIIGGRAVINVLKSSDESPNRQSSNVHVSKKPFDEVVDKPTKDEVQMVENLKVIEFGTWLEYKEGRRVKIAWHDSRNNEYMLVDQMGRRVDKLTGLALAREMIAGKLKIISGSSKPFFERALENIYDKLNNHSRPTGVDDHVNT